MSKVRFTAFADLHHHPAWFKNDAIGRLSKIQERAHESRRKTEETETGASVSIRSNSVLIVSVTPYPEFWQCRLQ